MSSDDTRDTALSHTPRTPTLPVAPALKSTSNSNSGADSSSSAAAAARDTDGPAEEVELDFTMKKKKKKKKKDEDDGAEDGAGSVAAPSADAAPGSGPTEDGGLDLTMKKRRKKKVEDDFTAKLKKLEIDGTKTDGTAAEAADAVADEGDMAEGTGLWGHNESRSISYDMLLGRFFFMLSQKHPDHALSGSRSYKIPPPVCMREGNKKTIFANLAEICKRMKRSEEHITAYLFAELGTSGSTDGSRRLVIKGRFQQKQIEAVVRTYIIEYVTCATCKSADTELSKGENRLYFITCNSCGSRRSVLAIKTGFSAQVGKRKKM